MNKQAKVLRLLRYDAKKWWYFQQLRSWGNIEEAQKLERKSIRNNVKEIRELREHLIQTYRTSVLEFAGTSTTMISGCHPGFFAAFIYCYANRIGKVK